MSPLLLIALEECADEEESVAVNEDDQECVTGKPRSLICLTWNH